MNALWWGRPMTPHESRKCPTASSTSECPEVKTQNQTKSKIQSQESHQVGLLQAGVGLLLVPTPHSGLRELALGDLGDSLRLFFLWSSRGEMWIGVSGCCEGKWEIGGENWKFCEGWGWKNVKNAKFAWGAGGVECNLLGFEGWFSAFRWSIFRTGMRKQGFQKCVPSQEARLSSQFRSLSSHLSQKTPLLPQKSTNQSQKTKKSNQTNLSNILKTSPNQIPHTTYLGLLLHGLLGLGGLLLHHLLGDLLGRCLAHGSHFVWWFVLRKKREERVVVWECVGCTELVAYACMFGWCWELFESGHSRLCWWGYERWLGDGGFEHGLVVVRLLFCWVMFEFWKFWKKRWIPEMSRFYTHDLDTRQNLHTLMCPLGSNDVSRT